MQTTKSTNCFECQVCYESYNDSDHLPKVLPCGHSCCLKCTKIIFGRRNSITCPVCRKVTKIQPTSLPTNYIVFEALPSATVHSRDTMCPKHNNKILEFYCSDCRVCVCSSCFFNDHKGHEGMEVPDDALAEMKSSSSLLSKLDVVCGEIPLTVTQLNKVEMKLKRKEANIAASIHESFNQIRAALDEREAALISSLSSKRLAVTSHKHRLESFLADVQTSAQSFRDLLQSSDVVHFHSVSESIVASLSRLDDDTKSDGFREKWDSYLSWDCENAGVIKSINQFGKIISNPRQNELESRRTVVDILKQTRGISNWNVYDDDDDYENANWSEELPLGEWNGMAPEWTDTKRFLVDENGKIMRLCLNCFDLEEELPDSIGSLASLSQLDVSNNQLTRIPDSIGNLTHLKELYVEGNQLTRIPDSIGSLTFLTSLNVRMNQLTHLPDSIGNLTALTSLNVSENDLTRLPDSIGNLTALTELSVRNNPVTSTQAGKDEVKRRFRRAGLTISV